MEWGRSAEDELFSVNYVKQQICRSAGSDNPALKVPDGHPFSTAFVYIPTIHSLGVQALNPERDPVYSGSLQRTGGLSSSKTVGPIQPPKQEDCMWLQVSRYGDGVALEDLVDYIMEQRPPHPRGMQPRGAAAGGQPISPREAELKEGPFWVVVDFSLGVAIIEKILNLHLLRSNTPRCEVVALIQYYAKCFVEERKLSLPYLPKVDRGLLCFWNPAQSPL